MAKATAGAGYRELKRVGNYIAPNVSKAADRLAANARQQKSLNAAEKARQDKRLDDALKEADVDTEALQSKVTGFQNRDDVARDYATTATERSMKYAQLAREAATSGDWKTHRAYIDRMNRIKGDFKNAVNDEKFLGDLFSQHQKSFLDGKIDDDDWLDFMEAIEDHNYEVGLDENDNRVVTALVKKEDGSRERITKNISDIVNGNERPYEVVTVNGKGGLVDEMLVGFGKRKYDSEGKNYITTEQVWDDKNEQAFSAKVKGLQSNDRTMYSLLKQASNDQIRKKGGFTQADKDLVKDYLYKQVRGQYDESTSQKVRQLTPDERLQENARNRAIQRRGQDLSQKRSDDRLALDWYKALNPNSSGKGKQTEEQMTMSRLHQDAADFSENSKPQVLNGTTIAIDKREYTVYDTLEPKGEDYVTVYMKDSRGNIKKEDVPKTKRGFLDFKLKSPQYKKYTPDKVLSQPQLEYQELSEQAASQVQAAFNARFKDKNGKFNGNDDDFVSEMREAYNLSQDEIDTTIGFFNFNTVEIGNTQIDLDDDDAMLQVDRAIREVKGLNNRTTKTPSTNTGGGFDPNAY